MRVRRPHRIIVITKEIAGTRGCQKLPESVLCRLPMARAEIGNVWVNSSRLNLIAGSGVAIYVLIAMLATSRIPRPAFCVLG